MLTLCVLSVILTCTLLFSKSIWDRMLSLSSLSVKVSVFILILAKVMDLEYMVDIGVIYAVVGGAGTMVVISLLLRSEME